MSITKKIKSFEDACEQLGVNPEEVIAFKEPKFGFQKAANSAAKLTVIAEALNEGWVPDWDDHNQWKYYPWFRMAGSGFAFTDFVRACTYSDDGSRLVFKSAELAEYAGNQFSDIYHEFMVIE